jgi:hypothetical protein
MPLREAALLEENQLLEFGTQRSSKIKIFVTALCPPARSRK